MVELTLSWLEATVVCWSWFVEKLQEWYSGCGRTHGGGYTSSPVVHPSRGPSGGAYGAETQGGGVVRA